MNRLDRIDHDLAAIDAVNYETDMHADEIIADHALCLVRELRPLLPLLRFWLEAEDQYKREKGLENTPATTLRKCLAADEALRAALRDSGGVP